MAEAVDISWFRWQAAFLHRGTGAVFTNAEAGVAGLNPVSIWGGPGQAFPPSKGERLVQEQRQGRE